MSQQLDAELQLFLARGRIAHARRNDADRLKSAGREPEQHPESASAPRDVVRQLPRGRWRPYGRTRRSRRGRPGRGRCATRVSAGSSPTGASGCRTPSAGRRCGPVLRSATTRTTSRSRRQTAGCVRALHRVRRMGRGPPRRLRTWSSPPTTSAPVPAADRGERGAAPREKPGSTTTRASRSSRSSTAKSGSGSAGSRRRRCRSTARTCSSRSTSPKTRSTRR